MGCVGGWLGIEDVFLSLKRASVNRRNSQFGRLSWMEIVDGEWLKMDLFAARGCACRKRCPCRSLGQEGSLWLQKDQESKPKSLQTANAFRNVK